MKAETKMDASEPLDTKALLAETKAVLADKSSSGETKAPEAGEAAGEAAGEGAGKGDSGAADAKEGESGSSNPLAALAGAVMSGAKAILYGPGEGGDAETAKQEEK
jgi:hypothetical protein